MPAQLTLGSREAEAAGRPLGWVRVQAAGPLTLSRAKGRRRPRHCRRRHSGQPGLAQGEGLAGRPLLPGLVGRLAPFPWCAELRKALCQETERPMNISLGKRCGAARNIWQESLGSSKPAREAGTVKFGGGGRRVAAGRRVPVAAVAWQACSPGKGQPCVGAAVGDTVRVTAGPASSIPRQSPAHHSYSDPWPGQSSGGWEGA